MKLLFAIVEKEDTRALTRALVENNISVTRISSSGGFLGGGNMTLMIGVEADRLETALTVIREKSSRRHAVTVPMLGVAPSLESPTMPMKVMIGGATVFVLDVESFHKF